jgi:hypothetical protein
MNDDVLKTLAHQVTVLHQALIDEGATYDHAVKMCQWYMQTVIAVVTVV